MKVWGIVLILLSIIGYAGVLTFKYFKHTFKLIGPKSSIAFIICGILLIMGIRFLSNSKK